MEGEQKIFISQTVSKTRRVEVCHFLVEWQFTTSKRGTSRRILSFLANDIIYRIKPFNIFMESKKKVNGVVSILIFVKKKQSGKLIRQPVYFPQRGKSTYSSARSPLLGTMPARLRMASYSDCLTSKEIITEIKILPMVSGFY